MGNALLAIGLPRSKLYHHAGGVPNIPYNSSFTTAVKAGAGAGWSVVCSNHALARFVRLILGSFLLITFQMDTGWPVVAVDEVTSTFCCPSSTDSLCRSDEKVSHITWHRFDPAGGWCEVNKVQAPWACDQNRPVRAFFGPTQKMRWAAVEWGGWSAHTGGGFPCCNAACTYSGEHTMTIIAPFALIWVYSNFPYIFPPE